MNVKQVVSLRVPRELKKRMKSIDINWSEEIREFIEARVREHKKKKAIEGIDEMLKNIKKVEMGTAAKYVREDRDSR